MSNAQKLGDILLLERSLVGVEAYWRHLERTYGRLVDALIDGDRGWGDEGDASDEVLVSVVRKLLTLREPVSLRAWLRRMALRQARARWLTRAMVQGSRDPGFLLVDDDSESESRKSEASQLLRAAMAELPIQDQRLIHACYLRAKKPSQGQLARSLDVTPDCIGSLKQEALEQLREHMIRLYGGEKRDQPWQTRLLPLSRSERTGHPKPQW